ncbi:hypothetical protein [Caballeronia sp. S22]|uniref:hypothetical protein n=1 Tax=Caballeronia sp. S22 TaxID=3137182 RepID=UPI0035316019
MPYVLYVVGLWILIVFPVLIVLVRLIRKDVSRRREVLFQLNGSFPTFAPEDNELDSGCFEQIVVAFQSYVGWLKEVAERYISLIILVSLGLLYEQLTSSKLTTTTQSLDWAKVALWFLLGPSLIALVMIVALGYQGTARRVQSVYGRFAAGLIFPGNSALFDRVTKERSSLIWERGPTDFVLNVLKSATVAVPLFIALVAYVLPTITGGNWVEIFLPNSFIDMIRHLYSG